MDRSVRPSKVIRLKTLMQNVFTSETAKSWKQKLSGQLEEK